MKCVQTYLPKYRTLFVVFLSLIPISQALSACDATKPIAKQMEITATNIVNARTALTLEGGPYQKQSVYCSDSECFVSKDPDFILVHDPSHKYADDKGNVLLPNINLEEEKEKMNDLVDLYDKAVFNCLRDRSLL